MQFRYVLSILAAIFLCACGNKEEKKPGIRALSSVEISETEKQARQGDPLAQLLIGRHYLYGLEEGRLGKKADLERAFSYLSDSAKNGNPEAMLLVSRCYFDGTGTKDDVKMSAQWLDQAINNGAPLAKTRGAYFLITRNKSESLKILKEAAAEGETEAQVALAHIYQGEDSAYPMAGNYGESFKLLTSAAEAGNASAQRELANMYSRGKGTSRDMKLAYEWSKKSTSSGDDWCIISHAYFTKTYAQETKTEKDLVHTYAYHLALIKILERKLVKDVSQSNPEAIQTIKETSLALLKLKMTPTQITQAESEQEKIFAELETAILAPDRFLRNTETNFILTGKLPKLN
jgi:TPR repeat protein